MYYYNIKSSHWELSTRLEQLDCEANFHVILKLICIRSNAPTPGYSVYTFLARIKAKRCLILSDPEIGVKNLTLSARKVTRHGRAAAKADNQGGLMILFSRFPQWRNTKRNWSSLAHVLINWNTTSTHATWHSCGLFVYLQRLLYRRYTGHSVVTSVGGFGSTWHLRHGG